MLNLIEDEAFTPEQNRLQKNQINKIIEKRRLWKHQIRRCFEIYRLHQIQKTNKEDDMDDFRIYVKKRILRQNREHLELFEQGPERKAELNTMYNTLIAQYREIIMKISLYKTF